MKKLRNQFEIRINRQLKRSKVDYGYETERIPYILARHYEPDFIIKTPLGKIYVECKGYFRPEHKAKMKAVKKQNPSKDFRILFYARREKDIRWCEKHGFKYAIGKIPDEWLL